MCQQKSSSRATEMHISSAGCTDRGRVRQHNEDAVALREPADQAMLAELGRLYLLADGAGGHAAGEIASKLAVETISSVYYDQTSPTELGEDNFQSQGVLNHLDGPFSDLDIPLTHIRKAFFIAHTRIRQLAALKREYQGMATTCIAAVVKDTRVLIAHVGDSRAYLIRASGNTLPTTEQSHLKSETETGSWVRNIGLRMARVINAVRKPFKKLDAIALLPTITRLTMDHSMVTELARVGVISPEQMQNSPSRHIILRALGGKEQESPGPDITTCRVRTGDTLLLCCDGLWSMLTEEQIAQALSHTTPQVACAELIRLANEAGGEDNISAVVLAFK